MFTTSITAMGTRITYMGSHHVTCHSVEVTFPSSPQLVKAGTQFSDPGEMQGWVDLVGWLHSEVVHHQKMVNHPSTEWARRRVTVDATFVGIKTKQNFPAMFSYANTTMSYRPICLNDGTVLMRCCNNCIFSWFFARCTSNSVTLVHIRILKHAWHGFIMRRR